MADRTLRLRVLGADGEPGEQLGTISVTGDRVSIREPDGDVLVSLLDRAMRLNDTDEIGAFSAMATTGWTNGALMLDTS